jgi:hypothetical protein
VHTWQAISVAELKEGDQVDLEGDLFADPKRTNSLLQSEYAVVESVTIANENCIAVSFDFDIVGFPRGHHVRRIDI